MLISKTNTPTCPVNILLRYFHLAEIPADSTDYIFRPLCFCKSVNSYKLRSGKLSYTTTREILLSALETLGLNKIMLDYIVLDQEELQLLQQQKSRTDYLKNTVAGEPTKLRTGTSKKTFRKDCQLLKILVFELLSLFCRTCCTLVSCSYKSVVYFIYELI